MQGRGNDWSRECTMTTRDGGNDDDNDNGDNDDNDSAFAFWGGMGVGGEGVIDDGEKG
jgi:hypothetical protein